MPKTKKQRDLMTALQQFYHQPVARVSIELFLSIGMILFFAVFAIRPTVLTMSDLLKEIEDKKQLDQQLSKKIAALSTAQSVYLELKDQLYVLDQALPNSPQLVSSLKVIEKAASELDLIITGMSVNEIPEEKTVQNIELEKMERVDVPVTIALSGSYPTIRQFVERLKNYRRSFVISNLTFNTQQTRGNKELEARITVSMPYFGEDALDKKTD